MMVDKQLGRYHIVNNKWLRLFVHTPKSTDGWEFQFEVARRHRGPGIWFLGGNHPVLTLWLTPNRSLDIVRICGDCALCEMLYKQTGKKKVKVTWN